MFGVVVNAIRLAEEKQPFSFLGGERSSLSRVRGNLYPSSKQQISNESMTCSFQRRPWLERFLVRIAGLVLGPISPVSMRARTSHHSVATNSQRTSQNTCHSRALETNCSSLPSPLESKGASKRGELLSFPKPYKAKQEQIETYHHHRHLWR